MPRDNGTVGVGFLRPFGAHLGIKHTYKLIVNSDLLFIICIIITAILPIYLKSNSLPSDTHTDQMLLLSYSSSSCH
jgi:hypothetical protein